MDKYKSLVSEFLKSSDTELEARYVGKISSNEFDRCINYCRSEDYTESKDEYLDIFAEDHRIQIKGNENIRNYCKTNTLPEHVEIIIKTPMSNHILNDFDFKINLKSEKQVDNPELLEKLHVLDKSYRLKKRYSFLYDNFRIDLTVVKSAMGAYKSFVSSNVNCKPEQFEIEIEVIKKNDKLSTDFLKEIQNLYLAIQDEEYFCSKTEKTAVLKEYLMLCYHEIPFNYETAPRKYFAGPQPVTLERKNLLDDTLGVISIKKDYTVTEKANGERHLLYISKDGKCYFINNRLTVKYAGVKSSLKQCLLDGEYITTDILGNSIKIFAVFDAYYNKGENIMSLPLIGKTKSRLSDAENIVNTLKVAFKKEDYEIKVKDFLSNNIFEDSKTILNSSKFNKFAYGIDGLIYTPKYLPVGATHMDSKIDKPVTTWIAAFKWKPVEENTIDFMVKFRNMAFVDSIPYKVLELYVGYDPSRWDKINAKLFLEQKFTKKSSYIGKLFKPADVLNDEICLAFVKDTCENGDKIEDDSIIEFRYDTKWYPVRMRRDKTELYRKTKSLSGAVNDYSSAMNVWRSITYAVTEEMISGEEPPGDLPPAEDVYFDRHISRDLFASAEMMAFHNDIKRAIINKYAGKSVLELACGKGGDLGKYIDAGFTRLLGFDYSRDNIENPVDGIYARYSTRKKTENLKYVFLTYDCSKKIESQSFETDDDKYVAEVLYGMRSDKLLSKYHKMALEPFDLVSCQFAIHYFFETEEKLDTFLLNVDNHLKPGGYFIGTTLNGEKVKDALYTKKTLTGEKNKHVLWNIEKMYTKSQGVNFGEKIDVFMESIGRINSEYLVNIDILKQKLNKMGYEFVMSESFETFYNEKFNMDEIQKEYSFMNMIFVFKKRENKTRILKKKDIKLNEE